MPQATTATNLDVDDGDRITRGSTGIRVLLTLLFTLVWAVAESALGVIVVISILWALITGQAPPPLLREFANRLVTYAYRIWRYVTYNEAQVPFPFSEFPPALEEPGELGPDEAAEVRDLLPRRDDEEDDYPA